MERVAVVYDNTINIFSFRVIESASGIVIAQTACGTVQLFKQWSNVMTALQMEKELLSKWHALSREKQQEALDFVQCLNAETSPAIQPLQSALGLCADLNLFIGPIPSPKSGTK